MGAEARRVRTAGADGGSFVGGVGVVDRADIIGGAIRAAIAPW